MIRPQFKTYRKGVPQLPADEQEEIKYRSDDFLQGLITDADPADLPDSALSTLVNGTYIKNQLFRRNGLRIYSIAKPDSNAVLNIFAYFNTTNGASLLRFTKSSIYKSTSTGWIAIVGAALSGTDLQPFRFTVSDERLFASNDGADNIIEINTGTNTYAALGNAPKYRFITAAFNRVIGAYKRDIADSPVEVGWSGDLNYGEWNPAVDISAGSTPLVDSPSDLSDVITGIFSLESCICITRERSIWLGTNQASATDPFYFFSSVPRVGADAPSTIQVFKGGLMFYSYKDSAVYEFTPNPNGGPDSGKIVDLSLKVKRAIKNDLLSSNIDPQRIFATLNYDTNIYTLFIPNSANPSVIAYSYNRDTQTWSTETYTNITCCNDVDFAGSTLSIDDLTGTISALAGTIDELGGFAANSNRLFGASNGNIYTQPFFAGFQAQIGDIELDDDGTVFELQYISKEYSSLPIRQQIKYIMLVITPFTSGNITISIQKNKNGVFTPLKTIAIGSDRINKTTSILCKKPISCFSYNWQLSSSDCMFTLDGFNGAADPGSLFK